MVVLGGHPRLVARGRVQAGDVVLARVDDAWNGRVENAFDDSLGLFLCQIP